MLCMLAFADLCELTIVHINLLKPDLSLRLGAIVQHVQKKRKKELSSHSVSKTRITLLLCLNIFSFSIFSEVLYYLDSTISCSS